MNSVQRMMRLHCIIILLCLSLLTVKSSSNVLNNFNISNIEDIEAFLTNELPDFMFQQLLNILNISSFSVDAENMVGNMVEKGFGQVLALLLTSISFMN